MANPPPYKNFMIPNQLHMGNMQNIPKQMMS